jgi:lauroyl/myristoyl acyltransferase
MVNDPHWIFRAGRRIPSWLDAPLVDVVSRGFSWLAHEKHEAVLHNHRMVHSAMVRAGRAGHPPADSAGRALRVQAANYLEMLRAPGMSREVLRARVRMTGVEVLDEALALGRGAVLIGLHMGDWESSGLALAERGYRLAVVAGTQMNPAWSPHLRRFKESFGIQVVSPADSYRTLYRALQRGGVVALLVDGDLFRRSATVPFFGMPARFPLGPSLLSLRTGAPMVLGYSLRRDRWDVSFHVGGRLDPLPARPEAATARLARRLEQVLADHLDQWCATRRLWEGETAAP